MILKALWTEKQKRTSNSVILGRPRYPKWSPECNPKSKQTGLECPTPFFFMKIFKQTQFFTEKGLKKAFFSFCDNHILLVQKYGSAVKNLHDEWL